MAPFDLTEVAENMKAVPCALCGDKPYTHMGMLDDGALVLVCVPCALIHMSGCDGRSH